MQVCSVVAGYTVPSASGMPFKPSITAIRMSLHPRVFRSLKTFIHLITLAFTQHGPAQRGFAADDLNELSAADQLHAAPIRAKKELLLLIVGID